MGRWFAVIILTWPILEITGLILLSDRVGLGATLALVALGFVAGFMVLRRTGLQAVDRLRSALDRGEEPGLAMFDAACFTVAGFLLIIPGPISDVLAIVLMLPWTRRLILRWVAARFETRVYRQQSTIQGEYRVVAEEPGAQPREGNSTAIEHDKERQ